MAEITQLKSRRNPRRTADEVRREKNAIPNGAKAFRAIAAMGNPTFEVRQAANALRLIAEGQHDEAVVDALYLIVRALLNAHTDLEKHYSDAWAATWGFVHGPSAGNQQVG